MLRTLIALVPIALLALSVPVFAEDFTLPDQLPKKEHPYLYLERSDIPQIVKKAEQYDWARKELETIRKEAEKWSHEKIEVPPTTGRHSLNYLCPECKVLLKTESPTRHKCPKCGKIYSGLPYDACLYGKRNGQLSNAAVTLGLVSLIDNRSEYARKSLEILLKYAERYGSYPILDNQGRPNGKTGGRAYDQTLGEAGWLINLAWAYDLVLGANVGTEAEHRMIEENLLRASAKTLLRNRMGKSNWQSFHNAGLTAVALVLRDRDLLKTALEDPENGFLYQMKESVTSDGIWYEGSWSYHTYALQALVKTTEAAYHSGIDLYQIPAMRKLFEAPLNCMQPDGKLPSIHDGEVSSPSAVLYEIAAARYHDPAFEGFVAKSDRRSLNALLEGIDQPKRQDEVALKSANLPGIGVVVLRRGGQYLLMDYGPHGGWHGHYDKLAVHYYAAGQVSAPDPGRAFPYNLPIHTEWYKHTLSHNTLVVDGHSQAEATGVLESSRFGGDYDLVTARVDGCYEGVTLRRTLAMGDGWLLDIAEASSDKEHTYDWIWHGYGDSETDLAASPTKLTESHISYSYLKNPKAADGSRDWDASWKLADGTIHARFQGSPERQVILADAPGNPPAETLHCILLRNHGKTARFITLFSQKPMHWTDLPPELIPR